MDLNWLVRSFHDEIVMMSSADTERIRLLRDTVIQRIESRLTQARRPTVHQWINQGSYAMNTMIRDLNTGKPDMDLDIGIVFRYEDLITRLQTEYTPIAVKRWIIDGLSHGNQKEPPQIRKNCTTVWYNTGEQIDVPIYRITRLYRGDEHLELASNEWVISDPLGVNEWFTDQCQRSPETAGSLQVRRIVRLFKALARSQNPPLSGFAITTLVVNNYVPKDGRDDYSFYLTGRRMLEALSRSTFIEHPVLLGRVIDRGGGVIKYRDRLSSKLTHLSSAFTTNNERVAVLAWLKVFPHAYFRKVLAYL